MTRLTFTMYRLLSQRLLLCNEAILASYPFLGSLLLREGEGCTLHFRTPDPRSKNTKHHKSNAESEHVYCSIISIPTVTWRQQIV